MHHRSGPSLLSTLTLGCALACLGWASEARAADGAIPTFHSIGVTWSPSGGSATKKATVKVRPSGGGITMDALPLWFDARDGEYRGSVVGLVPGTSYEIILALEGTATTQTMTAATWSESPPVGKTVTLPATSSKTLLVNESGSASGYVLYTGAPGPKATIDVANGATNDIVISASYVIVRGLTLKGASRDAIRLVNGAHDVIIEDNDISEWGGLRDAQKGWGSNEDSAVRADNVPTLERVIIQRNRIHDPRYDTNSWSFGHPAGPQGVTFNSVGGQHVIRYNEILGSEKHHYNDCIGGGENYSDTGFPNRDSDLYGNVCTYAWDDAIEIEGGNRNVRAWGNFFDFTATGIASATTAVGPLYVFRNVYLHSQKLSEVSLDQDDRGPFAKTGQNGTYGGGRRYFFHNTVLQPAPAPGMTYSWGAGAGIADDGGPLTNTVSRNNVWQNFKDWHGSIDDDDSSSTNDFDFDLHNGPINAYSGAEAHGIKGVPVYASGHGAVSGRGGLYSLAPTSPGVDKADRIPNFNDGFTGAAPDMGAHESGAAAMKFGLDVPASSGVPGTLGSEGTGGAGAGGANGVDGGIAASASNGSSPPETPAAGSALESAETGSCATGRVGASRVAGVGTLLGLIAVGATIRTRRRLRATRPTRAGGR